MTTSNNKGKQQMPQTKWFEYWDYVQYLDRIKDFGISQEDSKKLDKALDDIESILDKIEQV